MCCFLHVPHWGLNPDMIQTSIWNNIQPTEPQDPEHVFYSYTSRKSLKNVERVMMGHFEVYIHLYTCAEPKICLNAPKVGCL